MDRIKKEFKTYRKLIISLLLFIVLNTLNLYIPTTNISRSASAKQKISLNKSSITILINHTFKLKLNNANKTPKWSSSDKTIVTVDKSGTIKAISKGTAKIRAKLGKKQFICKVKAVNYDDDMILAAYGYKALCKILPKNSGLKISECLSGTYYSNKEFIYYDATFKDKSGNKKRAYIHIYLDFGEALANHTVTTKYYTDNLIVRFVETPLDQITRDNRTKELALDKVKKISKLIFSLETLTVKKGVDFDKTHEWLEL